MGDVSNLKLGEGQLYLNGVNVGFLSGEVELEFQRKALTFSPAGSGSTNLIAFGTATLRASIAEFSAANLKLALGTSNSIETGAGSLSYDPTSYSFDTLSTSWEGLRFGGESLDGSLIPLRFDCTLPTDKNVVVILYTATPDGQLKVPFSSERVTMYNKTFIGIPDESRANGDKVGIIFEEV